MIIKILKTHLPFLLITAGVYVNAGSSIVIEAGSGSCDQARVLVNKARNGVALKENIKSNADNPQAPADVVYNFNVPEAGRYNLFSNAALAGRAAYARMLVAVDEQLPREKVVISPWKNLDNCREHLLKTDLAAGKHQLKIWLPEKTTLVRLEFTPFKLPQIPRAAASYQPAIVPPESRTRLLISRNTLPEIKRNLTIGENKPFWESVKTQASQPYAFIMPANKIVGIDDKLLDIAVKKAFVHLMEDDRQKGLEAVKLIRDYIQHVEFGNQLDVFRPIGQVIYSSALVYDWCYGLMTMEDKTVIRENMMRLAEDMEIGWPPFLQTIINGHGNESQVSRDLLSMSIAIYNEDPLPYRLCSYKILEELVPAHNSEFSSGRHSQGSVVYGPFRFSWDMYAAWIFYRMSGKEIFSQDIRKVPYFWIYMKTPDGGILPDGDGAFTGKLHTYQYNLLLTYAFANDPLLKGEFERQNGMVYAKNNAVLFLLLNNPSLKAESSLAALPLTRYFGDPLGSMVCRTGWNLNRYSADAVVEMKGAGVQHYNHQHLDAGAFQIYYRGMLAADLGVYQFYGTPYDMNFNKRSVAHNVMLAYDPQEQFPSGKINDGGQKFLNGNGSPNGAILAHDSGPNLKLPLYSYLKAGLARAYSNKISSFDRSFCFLNLGMKGIPAALITFDRITTAKPDIKKYWQLNSLNQPDISGNIITIVSNQYGTGSKLTVNALLPESGDLEIATFGGKDAHTVFGHSFEPPYQLRQTGAWRTMISTKKPSAFNRFLNVMVMSDSNVPAPEVDYIAAAEYQGVIIADRIVCFAGDYQALKSRLTLEIPSDNKAYQLLFNDLSPGLWTIKSGAKNLYQATVKPDTGNIFAILPPGKYEIIPGGAGREIDSLPDYSGMEAKPSPDAADITGKVLLNRNELPVPPVKQSGRTLMVPAEKIFESAGLKTVKDNNRLLVKYDEQQIAFTAGSADCVHGDYTVSMPAGAILEKGVWYLPEYIVGGIIGCDTVPVTENKSVWFNSLPEDLPRIIKLESSQGNDMEELQSIFTGGQIKDYWAANGRDTWIKIYLLRPQTISGIGIRWLNGDTRKASFSVETSMDGKAWQPGFRDESSGTCRDTELYRFSPRRARLIRFNGNGNNQNNWNSIHYMKILE